MTRDRALLSLLLPIALAASWARIAGSLAEPLWLDEAYSAYAAGNGWGFLWHVVPRYETHPPFYYSLVRLWSLAFGDGLAALRALGFACGLATVPATALAARALARTAGLDPRRTALAAAALVALAPGLVEMSREVRPYPVMSLVYAAALGGLLRLGRGARDERRLPRAALAGYAAALAAMLWLHNLGPLYGLALGLAALALVACHGLPAREWALLVGAHAAAGLAWLPGLLILIDQAPTWVSSTWLTFGWQGMIWKLALLWGAPGAVAVMAMAALAVLGVAALVRAPDGWRCALALALAAGVPVAASLALSVAVAPVFIVRTMTPVAVPALLLMAAGITGGRGLARYAGLGAGLVLASQMAVHDWAARQAGPMQDWYGAVRWLAVRYRPGDVVLAYPNEGALPFDRAVRDLGLAMPSVPIPTPVPSLGVGGWHPTGSRGVVSLPRDRLRAIAGSRAVAAAPTVWLLRLGPWAYDKGDVFLKELRQTRMDSARFRSGPIDIIGLWSVQAAHCRRSGIPLRSCPAWPY